MIGTLNYNFYFIPALLFFVILFWIGHGIGQHRYLSHNSIKLNIFWHTVVLYIASLIPFGSPLGWAVAHRTHHRHNGTNKDSYYTKNPFKIFLCMTNANHITFNDGKIIKSKIITLTHRYYHLNLIVFNIGLFFISPLVWYAYICGCIGVCLAFIWTWAIAHKKFFFSYQNFTDNSYNDLFCGYILGEWHNNHHAQPGKANQQVRWWEVDILYHISRIIKSA
jgi:stearoyl-CoA desaturase (delta-9 desaturase)